MALTDILSHINTELRDTTNNRWTAAEKTLAVNKAIKYVADYFIAHKCWEPLAPLQIKATYTLVAAQSEYSVYTVIGSSTNYKCFIKLIWMYRGLREVTIEEEEKIISGGEYDPTCDRPYIRFWGYDSTANHGKLPKFEIKPTPGSADTIYYYYLKNVTDLSADADIPEILGCDPLIEEVAELFLTIKDRDTQESGLLFKTVDDKLQKIVTIHEKPTFHEVEWEQVY